MKKITLLIIALVLIATPNTIAYFKGQHTYESRTCVDCHASIEQDVLQGTTAMAAYDCTICHYFISITNSSVKGHNAVNNACNDCHPDAEDQFITRDDSHKNFYQESILDDSMLYANEACHMCHSDSSKNMIYTRPEFIEFEVVNTSGNWTIQNFLEGNEMNYNVALNRNNGLHTILGGADVGCTECHTDITNAIDIGGHYPVNTTFHAISSTCALCHDNYDQGGRAQHVSKSTTCISCHTTHNGSILSSIDDYSSGFEGNICLGCHKNSIPYLPANNSTTNFKVYLEPGSDVIIT